MTICFHTNYTELVCEGNPYVSLNLQGLRLIYLESELDDVILVDLFAESVHFNFWQPIVKLRVSVVFQSFLQQRNILSFLVSVDIP